MIGRHGELIRRLSSAALGGVLLLSVMACPRQDENALVVFGPDSVVVLAPLVEPAFKLPPRGSAAASSLELVSFDPAALDAFGRQAPLDNEGSWPYWDWWYGGDEWDMGTVLGTEPAILGGNLDPRLPALTGVHSYDRSHWFVDGNAFAIGQDMFGYFCCVTPNDTFVVGLARLGLTVNGELDHTQILQGQAVDAPDELFFLGGSPGGDAFRDGTLFLEYTAEFGANPWLFGYVPSRADGRTFFWDVIMSTTDASGTQIYGDSPFDAYMAPNEQVRHTFPKYNYFVIWERNPDGTPDYTRPVARIQFGTDLSALGGPINNAYGPFPTSALCDAELAVGTGAVSRPDVVTFNFANLKALAGGAGYQLWSRMSDGSSQALTFEYTETLPDGTVNGPTAGVSSFVGGPGTHQTVADYPDDATHLFLSLEGSAATTPSNSQILWAAGLQVAGQPKVLNLPVSFGTFGESRTWAISGTATGGLFGDEFRERYVQLPRPPVGYKYVAWLVTSEGAATRLPDETFTSPPPEYAVLEQADTDTEISDVVQPNSILEAFTKICTRLEGSGETFQAAEGCYDLRNFEKFVLSLEPRASDPNMPGPTVVLEGLVPTPKLPR